MLSRNFWASPALVFPIAVTGSFPPAAPGSMCTYLSVLSVLFVPNDISAQMLSHVRIFALSWTVTCQAPLSMGFSRQEYWVELGSHFLLQGIVPTQGSNLCLLFLQADNYIGSAPIKSQYRNSQFTDKSNASLDLQPQSVSAIQKSIWWLYFIDI